MSERSYSLRHSSGNTDELPSFEEAPDALVAATVIGIVCLPIALAIILIALL